MPKQDDADLKKRRILETALALFSRNGFHATTTKQIAKESGVAEGLIFYYFGDKRKLLLYIVKNFSFAFRVQGSEDDLAKLPPEEALVRYGMKYMHFLQEHIDYILLIWSPEMIRDEAVSAEVLQLVESIGEAGGTVMARGMPPGATDGLQDIALMALTSSIFVYTMIRSRFGRSIHSVEEEPYVRGLVRLLLYGMAGQRQIRESMD